MAKTGYRPSAPEAVKAFCCECCGNYGDGRGDCEHQHCPMYSKHSFRRLPIKYDWVFEKWSKLRNYEEHRQILKLTKEQYVIQEILKGNPNAKISITHIFRAMCYSCCGDFSCGMPKEDCQINTCSIYYWMPYRTMVPNYDWMFDLKYTKRHNENALVLGYTMKSANGIWIVDRERYVKDYYEGRI